MKKLIPLFAIALSSCSEEISCCKTVVDVECDWVITDVYIERICTATMVDCNGDVEYRSKQYHSGLELWQLGQEVCE
jgi:hypothetical protein